LKRGKSGSGENKERRSAPGGGPRALKTEDDSARKRVKRPLAMRGGGKTSREKGRTSAE